MERKKNPFGIMFGKIPNSLIEREQKEQIIDSFLYEDSNIHVITGIRGSGKTVLLREIGAWFETQDDWVVLDLYSIENVMDSIASALQGKRKSKLVPDELSLHVPGINVGSVWKQNQASDDYIETVLAAMKKKGQSLLITIDEISSSQSLQDFVKFFQVLIGKDLPVYLLVAGLYENVQEIQNKKTMTFLYRAPRNETGSLSLAGMASIYERLLGLKVEEAEKMAQSTLGYPYAFQVLGHFTFRNGNDWKDNLAAAQAKVFSDAYEVIWKDLSRMDRQVLMAVQKGNGIISEARNILEMESGKFGVYRDRLIKKGLLKATGRGTVVLTLPWMDTFLKEKQLESAQ